MNTGLREIRGRRLRTFEEVREAIWLAPCGGVSVQGDRKQSLRADGALIDDLTVEHGLWEAKDTADDLQREIKAKIAKGYPLKNILFQSPDRAVLY